MTVSELTAAPTCFTLLTDLKDPAALMEPDHKCADYVWQLIVAVGLPIIVAAVSNVLWIFYLLFRCCCKCCKEKCALPKCCGKFQAKVKFARMCRLLTDNCRVFASGCRFFCSCSTCVFWARAS